jgi:hypothetical protein
VRIPVAKNRTLQDGGLETMESARALSGWSEDSDQSEGAYILYDDLVRSRDRLADLPPLTPHELERVTLAMHEVVWHLITPPRSVKTALPLAEDQKAVLLSAARDRTIDLYVMVVALVAQKLALAKSGDLAAERLALLKDELDALTFDYRAPKKETLSMLRDLRLDLDARIAYVRAYRSNGYQFLERPETYRNRSAKAERPDQFFHRVYGAHVRRGLTQADIRRVDPAFYNVLHVWCTRHERKLANLVPATRSRRS